MVQYTVIFFDQGTAVGGWNGLAESGDDAIAKAREANPKTKDLDAKAAPS
jgi:hypothetical protein